MLFQEYTLKGAKLKNRIVMAPMTRSRNPTGIADFLNAEYYRQRSGAGLIVTEGLAISESSMGSVFIPGIYTKEQVEGWKLTTTAAHAKGTVIFAQLWHVGRISHTSLQPKGQAPVSPSDIRAENSRVRILDENGTITLEPTSRPRALLGSEISEIVRDYANAAVNAIEAGFDGVEIHGANGYLIEQFLNPNVNTRSDRYGGTLENRSSFLLEVTDACIQKIGSDKVAVRLSPYGGLYDMKHYDEIENTYRYLAQELSGRNISYLHLMDQESWGSYTFPTDFLPRFRGWYGGTIILAGGLTKEKSEFLLKEGLVDLAAFGSPFIANPDLPERIKNNWELAVADRTLFYGGAEHGYTDYPNYAKDSNEAFCNVKIQNLKNSK